MTDTASPPEHLDESLMTIRDMCAAYDVTARALRFYESRELLAPLRRGQQRLYGRRDRARLTLIVRGKRFGFSLEQIRQLLDLYDPGHRNRTQTLTAVSLARERLADMEVQREELGIAITELVDLIALAERQLERTAPDAAPDAPNTAAGSADTEPAAAAPASTS